ncbi:MAG: helix-hairpin-helix domain-containing protein [Bacillota bacterium]
MFDWERRTQIVVLVLLGALVFGIGYKYAKVTAVPVVEISAENTQEQEGKEEIFVHVTGAVEKPGVYAFESGARVNDAVARAVPLPEADLNLMNLAAVLEDGKRIEVPVMRQGDDGQGMALSSSAQDNVPANGGKININTASAAELDTLPGIGPAYAERIIQYREKQGGFSSIEELQDVSGIGPNTYERIKDLVCIY